MWCRKKKEKPVNYIKKLEAENRYLKTVLASAREQVTEVQGYLLSDKFAGPDSDYVHVRTDMLPKLAAIKSELME
jgi:hypothetical protein